MPPPPCQAIHSSGIDGIRYSVSQSFLGKPTLDVPGVEKGIPFPLTTGQAFSPGWGCRPRILNVFFLLPWWVGGVYESSSWDWSGSLGGAYSLFWRFF